MSSGNVVRRASNQVLFRFPPVCRVCAGGLIIHAIKSPPVHAGGFCFAFLTKLAQTELLAGVSRIKAVVGPDTDGGFSIFSSRKVQWQRS
jgi:hypothetical protein